MTVSLEAKPVVTAAQTLDCSIIIPALNEAKVIGRCLSSLVELEFPVERFEVIVVDNGSTDATLKIVAEFHDRLQLRVLQRKAVKISALRNFGARESRGDVLAFLDSDCLAPRTWLAEIKNLLDKPGSGVAGAHYLLPPDSSWVGRVWHLYQEASKSGAVSHVPAGDLIMRREDFFRVSGFDESIQTNEDLELCARVRAAGMPVYAYPAVGVIHLGTAQTLGAFYRKQRWHGSHVARVFLRNLRRSGNRNAVLFALYTLLASCVVIAGTVWTIFSGPLMLPALGVFALFLPPLTLAAQRVSGKGKLAHFFPLTALYFVYGLARAQALLTVRSLR